jgi:hypothetical protein
MRRAAKLTLITLIHPDPSCHLVISRRRDHPLTRAVVLIAPRSPCSPSLRDHSARSQLLLGVLCVLRASQFLSRRSCLALGFARIRRIARLPFHSYIPPLGQISSAPPQAASSCPHPSTLNLLSITLITWIHSDSLGFTRIHSDSLGFTRIHSGSLGFALIEAPSFRKSDSKPTGASIRRG